MIMFIIYAVVGVCAFYWLVRGLATGASWRHHKDSLPKDYMYIYDPTGEKTYMYQNEEYLKRHMR